MHVWSTYDPLCTEYSVQVVIVNICTSMPLQSTSKGLLYSVQYQSAADRNGQRQMQLNRCRRRPPHGERRNLPIATSTCKVLWLRHMQVRCGVQWKQKICVTAAQSLQYVQYVQSTVLYSTLLCIHVCTSTSTRHNGSQLVTVIIECFYSARGVTMMSAKQWRLCPRSWARDVPWNEVPVL